MSRTPSRRPLGASGLSVAPIVFGTMAHGPPAAAASRIQLFRRAMDSGLTTFDTAPLYGYGRDEEMLGEAISTSPRDQVQILSKVGMCWDSEDQFGDVLLRGHDHRGRPIVVRKDSRPRSIRRGLEDSLRRLGTDFIDLVQVHHPDVRTPIAETMGALRDLKTEGKVRAIGVSNYSALQLQEAVRALGAIPLASNQVRYNLVHRQVDAELIPEARRLNVGILAYSALEQGLLAGRGLWLKLPLTDGRQHRASFCAPNRARIRELLERVVVPVAKRHDVSVAEVSLAWLLGVEGVQGVIAGASNPEDVALNARAAALELAPADWRAIDDAFRGLKFVADARAGRVVRARERLGRIARRVLRPFEGRN